MRAHPLTVVAMTCMLLGSADPARAQESGGSFGGSDFGGGGDYSGGSDSSGGSYDSGGGSLDFGGGGGSGGSFSAWQFGVALGVIVLIGFLATRFGRQRRRGSGRGSGGASGMQLAVLWLGIDWRFRRDVQSQLLELARSGQAGSAAGRKRLLVRTVRALRAAKPGWLYAGAAHRVGLRRDEAEPAFQGVALDARSRFRHEVVRDADGAVHEAASPDVRAHPHEGEGVVVVTLVIVARRSVRPPKNEASAEQLDRFLQNLSSVREHELCALEVIWSPAAEDDRMSTAELEALYKELQKIDERSMAGRAVCAYCSGPFAAELASCPHCGAPVGGQVA